jgi:integrase/recombinase XerD
LRYAQLKAFFNFIIDKCALDMKNPCHTSLLSKTFRMSRQVPKAILDKGVVDEMIYNTKNKRNRLIPGLQARCGLRIGELLKLRASEVSERRLTIKEPKSGKVSMEGCPLYSNKWHVALSHHDLRRYSATYASRNGVPLGIVSKVILRHQDLKTTQVYLGKVSEQEAIRWMDILHGYFKLQYVIT